MTETSKQKIIRHAKSFAITFLSVFLATFAGLFEVAVQNETAMTWTFIGSLLAASFASGIRHIFKILNETYNG